LAEVRFEHIYKSFDQVEIVHDVSMQIKDQEFLVLVGPSGSGKSTCLRMVAGLDEPSAGHIYIGDRLINGVDPKDRNIAMVFQNYALYPHMNVFDNVAFGLKLHHVPAQDITTRVQEAAEVLGLEPLLKRKPKQLSGGQRQRVALGRAIVRQAAVFLMDEPLSNLDAQLRVATRAEIIKLHRLIQTTIIYVTHDQVEAMTMGDRIAVLNAGSIQQLGSPQELYDHPTNIFVAGFIGSPSMNFFPNAKIIEEAGQTKVVLEGIGQIVVPARYVERSRAAAGKDLTFGIRPSRLEDVALIPSESQTGSTLDGSVDVVENLGDELLVYLTVAGRSVVAKLDPRSQVQAGAQVRLHVDNESMHLFDTATQEAIF
jgi:multiple sugar transport system ATP-binding protein